MEKRVIGIDIGGTNFRIGAVARDGSTKLFRRIPVRDVMRSNDVLRDLTNYLKFYCEELGGIGAVPSAVSIGFPATLDRERRVVLQAPNVAFMENLPVTEVLQRELQIPVMIERDVCMALYYDQEKYRIPDCEVLAGCYFGTGIGNAIQIYGRPLVGRNGTAGELGHIPVDGSEIQCGCGNIGCMENLAGGKYLAHLCEKVYKKTHVGDIFTEHGTEPKLQQFVDRIAQTVAGEINVLDPDYMMVGGGVLNMKDFPKEYLKERIYFHTRKPYPAKRLDDILIFTGDEENKCVIGAAFYAARKLKLF